MRKTLFLGMALFLIWGTGLAQTRQTAQAAFDEANTLFEEGDLNEAMRQYRSISKSGQVSGPLFLNMGITAIQLDSMGLAKYYFKKAQNFQETEAQAAKALEFVNRQFSRQSATLPKLPWDRAVQWIIDVPRTSGLFLAGFFITLSGLLLVYLKWFNKIHFTKLSSVIAVFLILGTGTAVLAFYADYVDQRYDEAVLIKTSSRVYESPDEESVLVSIAYEGYDLTVDRYKSGERENWYYIRLGNGQYGWISEEGIQIL